MTIILARTRPLFNLIKVHSHRFAADNIQSPLQLIDILPINMIVIRAYQTVDSTIGLSLQ